MSKIKRRASFLRPLLAAALPLGFLAAGALSAHAGIVTVTGANGRNIPYPAVGAGGAGGAATATTTTPGDPSNTATATGGNGGRGSVGHEGCFDQCVVWFDAGPGGAGGSATSQATTAIETGAAAATATSSGGSGGQGGQAVEDYYGPAVARPGGAGGAGGSASSAALASSGAGAATASATSFGGTGGAGAAGAFGGRGGAGGAPGSASATATGVALTGNAQANASATGGAGVTVGTASAQSEAKNASGEVLTTASSPGGGVGTGAGVGSPSVDPADVPAGRAVSNALLTPSGPNIGIGDMAAGYGGSGSAATYEATATFDFSASNSETLDLKLLSDSFADTSAGVAFDSLELEVVVDGGTPHTYKFTSLTGSGGAEKFFDADTIDLGAIAKGSQSVEIEYFLNYNSGTSAASGDGFGFTYALVDPPAPSVPEPSTWAMMAIGFASLVYAGYRRSRMGGAFAA